MNIFQILLISDHNEIQTNWELARVTFATPFLAPPEMLNILSEDIYPISSFGIYRNLEWYKPLDSWSFLVVSSHFCVSTVLSYTTTHM